jgi:hypothetical protein
MIGLVGGMFAVALSPDFDANPVRGGTYGTPPPPGWVYMGTCLVSLTQTGPCSGDCHGGVAPTVVSEVATPGCETLLGDASTTPCGGSGPCLCSVDALFARLPAAEVPLVTCGNCDQVPAGFTCYLTCSDPGFEVEGDAAIKCLNTGYADFVVQPACVPKEPTCPPLAETAAMGILTLRNGVTVPHQCLGARPGDECSFFCKPGYHMVGGETLVTCTEAGTWSSEPACVMQDCNSD